MRQVLVEMSSQMFTTTALGRGRFSWCTPVWILAIVRINVWADIAGDYWLGPHILSCQVTGHHYRDLLLSGLLDLPEGVPLAVRECMLFLHDGGPGRFSRVVPDVNSAHHT
jgi:hypothetical protein